MITMVTNPAVASGRKISFNLRKNHGHIAGIFATIVTKVMMTNGMKTFYYSI